MDLASLQWCVCTLLRCQWKTKHTVKEVGKKIGSSLESKRLPAARKKKREKKRSMKMPASANQEREPEICGHV